MPGAPARKSTALIWLAFGTACLNDVCAEDVSFSHADCNSSNFCFALTALIETACL